MKRIYLVRHGETGHNLKKMYQSPDIPLSENGVLGAMALATRCQHLDFSVVISSEFIRAQQTASVIAEATDQPHESFAPMHEVLNASSLWEKKFMPKKLEITPLSVRKIILIKTGSLKMQRIILLLMSGLRKRYQ